MCMTPEALAFFLTFLSPEIVEATPTRVTIHATEGRADWYLVDDQWCLEGASPDAPRIAL